MSTPDAARRSDESVVAEVTVAMQQYYEWFAAGRADLVASRSYHTPFLLIQPNGALVVPTEEAVRAGLEATMGPLMADGYARAEMLAPVVSVLGPGAAIVSGRFTRYRKDGTAISTAASTWLLAKTAAGWRIMSILMHDADTILRAGPAAG